MQQELDQLKQAIVQDYATWQDATGYDNPERVQEFADGIDIKPGNKYIKIITNNSVWGFIVAVDTDKKFRQGDILKAAGWAAPARNAARGNILDGGYRIRWTGPEYLR